MKTETEEKLYEKRYYDEQRFQKAKESMNNTLSNRNAKER